VSQDDEHIQTLTDLGLTLLQAKTYLALVTLGKAKVQTISKASNVARQDIYRIMPTLQKLGLAEKIIAAPIMYKAISLKEGLSILLQNKTREHTELQKKTIELLNNIHNSEDEKVLQDEAQQFSIISSKKLLLKRFAETDNITQKSINVVGKWKILKSILFHRPQDTKRALKRGVKIRIITEKHEDDKSIKKIIQSLKTNPLFEIRYLSTPLPVKTVIYDGTEVRMSIATSPDSDMPSLWSNNPSFLKVMTAYFEEIWDEALDASETFTRKSAKPKQPQTANSQHATKQTKSPHCIGSVSKSI
jgi:sugar-specific transcriptional regulator TrmB